MIIIFQGTKPLSSSIYLIEIYLQIVNNSFKIKATVPLLETIDSELTLNDILMSLLYILVRVNISLAPGIQLKAIHVY